MAQATEYDVVVVGSGPAGATTARVAAQHGLRVLLVDKRQELGAPIQCSGAVSAHALYDAGISPNEEFVSTAIFGFAIYGANGEMVELDYRRLKPDTYEKAPLGYVVDRRRFDRYLMRMAERVGVAVRLKTQALGYTPTADGLVKIHLKQFGETTQVCTRVIVGADGLQSQVGKWAGLRTHIRLQDLASCLQFIVDGVETKSLLEIITGQAWAPGGYAWIFPKGCGYAEVGLGVIRTHTNQDARWHLDHFIKHSFLAKRLRDYRILEVQGGGVPLAPPLKKQFADNVILVGDAARQVNPITGGGIHTALRGGVIAGEFLGDFFQIGAAPTAEHLAEYQQRWHTAIGETMWRLYQTKTTIFAQDDPTMQDQMLFKTMADYFHPNSEFRKV